MADELTDELKPELIQICDNLVTSQDNLKKHRIHGIIFVCISIIIVVIATQLLPEQTPFTDAPVIGIPTAIFVLIALFFFGKEEQKVEKERRKILGYNKLTFLSYQAFELLEKSKNKYEYLEKSKNKIESILTDLEINWDPKFKNTQSFKSLDFPIDEFKKSLKDFFIPSYTQIDADSLKSKNPEFEKRKISLIHLIQLFQSNNFQLIENVTSELNGYIKKEKLVDKSKWKKLQENISEKIGWKKLQENRTHLKIIRSIIGSGIIIVIGMIISHILSQHPDASYSDSVNWGLGIIIPSIIAYNVIIFRAKN